MMRRIGQTKSKKSFFKSKGPRRWPRQKSCVLYMLICVVTLLLFFSIEGTTITKISKKHVEFINLNKLYSKHASTVGTLNDRVAVLQVEVDEETKAGANNNSLKHVLESLSLVAQRSVVIGIPTITRKDNPDYLHRTLTSMKQHGFPMNAVYVMHANNAPHPVYEVARTEFSFHIVEPSNQSISIEYTPTRLDDGEVQAAYTDSSHQKQWRIREARDWRHLMETLLRTTNADFVVFNQDDGEWIGPYEGPSAPITSLWSKRDDQSDCHGAGGHCGMVSFVFERATLRKFLDWMAVDDRWKEKPIDWTLNDFVKEFGYKMPVNRIVRHIGEIRSFST